MKLSKELCGTGSHSADYSVHSNTTEPAGIWNICIHSVIADGVLHQPDMSWVVTKFQPVVFPRVLPSQRETLAHAEISHYSDVSDPHDWLGPSSLPGSVLGTGDGKGDSEEQRRVRYPRTLPSTTE